MTKPNRKRRRTEVTKPFIAPLPYDCFSVVFSYVEEWVSLFSVALHSRNDQFIKRIVREINERCDRLFSESGHRHRVCNGRLPAKSERGADFALLRGSCMHDRSHKICAPAFFIPNFTNKWYNNEFVFRHRRGSKPCDCDTCPRTGNAIRRSTMYRRKTDVALKLGICNPRYEPKRIAITDTPRWLRDKHLVCFRRNKDQTSVELFITKFVPMFYAAYAFYLHISLIVEFERGWRRMERLFRKWPMFLALMKNHVFVDSDYLKIWWKDKTKNRLDPRHISVLVLVTRMLEWEDHLGCSGLMCICVKRRIYQTKHL